MTPSACRSSATTGYRDRVSRQFTAGCGESRSRSSRPDCRR
jgi:hypothetical protein